MKTTSQHTSYWNYTKIVNLIDRLTEIFGNADPSPPHLSLDQISDYFGDADAFDHFICATVNICIEADEDLKADSLAYDIEEMLDMLTDKEKDILKKAYGIGVKEHSLDEIGRIYHLSRERVRQIKEKAIRRLKCRAPRDMKTYLA